MANKISDAVCNGKQSRERNEWGGLQMQTACLWLVFCGGILRL
ncbi:MAG: hypothetical protein Q4E16_07895 [Neisseria sp.]|nr:hypothetical protein [Neisseria sp.]